MTTTPTLAALAELPEPKYLARRSQSGEWLELLDASDWTAEMWAYGCDPVYSHEQLRAALAQPAPDADSFKNFHRSLCARFGYTHDQEYWWRDLVSLEEHIASLVPSQPTPAQAPGDEQRARELLAEELRRSGFNWNPRSRSDSLTDPQEAAIRAITAALSAQPRAELHDSEAMKSAWVRVYQLLSEVDPDFNIRPASCGVDRAVKSIRALQRYKQRDATNDDIAEWVERHDLGASLNPTDARAAFEDAQTWLASAPQRKEGL